jgi:peptidoglycan/xylan/chitin deacetylase (PgdA/CDA1 family)
MNTPNNLYKKLHFKWKYALNHSRGMIGLNERLFRKARGTRIVIYHGVCTGNPTLLNSLFVHTTTFEQHLNFYRNHFNIISLDDYFNGRFFDDRFNICITFDDGFANNYHHVLPLMNRYQVPIAFFVTAIREAGYDILWNDCLALLQKYGPPELSYNGIRYYRDKHRRYLSSAGTPSLRDYLQTGGFAVKEDFIREMQPLLTSAKNMAAEEYWLQMTPEQIRTLAASPYATIGCHGYYHNDLAQLSAAQAGEEMIRSRSYLEATTARAIHSIAFPYGSYTKEVVARAKAIGFSQLLAVDFAQAADNNDDALCERLTINPYISIHNQMTAIVHGKYNF